MTAREAYILGWVYGRIARTLPYDTPEKIQLAAQRPLSGFAQVHQAAIAGDTLTDNTRQDIADALAELSDAVCVTGQSESVLPLELQGSWQLGYYRAQSGQGLPAQQLDVAEMRKSKGMTQQQLADAVGVTQAMVARWETGRAKPSAKNAAKIIGVLT